MRKTVTMRQALSDRQLLADALPGDSWLSWRVLNIAAMGEALSDAERAIYQHLTGREREPLTMVDTWLTVAGRRSGKSRSMAVIAIYLSCLCDWSEELALGETGLALFLAPSERQAKTLHRYADAIVRHTPLLSSLVVNRTAETLSLNTGIDLEIMAANWRRARGGTAVCVILDECAFLHSADDSGNRDEDIYAAVKPSLATTGGPMLLTSSPSQMEGIVYRLHKRHYGAAGDPGVVVVQAASRELNPKLPQAVIDRAMEDDPTAAEAEYGGQFRQAVSAYLDRKVIERAVDQGIGARHPLPGVQYLAFTDVSGGSGVDSFTVAVGHKYIDDSREFCVIDALFEVRPPFDPDQAVKAAAAQLAQRKINSVVGDAYGGLWPTSAFARYGISYSLSPLSKSEIYLHVLPLWTAGRVRLLDNQRVVDQLAQLRRKVGSGGRESVDHVRGGHDDLANAVAGVLWRLSPVKHSTVTAAPVLMSAPLPDPFGNILGDTDAAHGWATRHYDEGIAFMRPDAGANRFSFGGRGI
jgi:hypothetical protein